MNTQPPQNPANPSTHHHVGTPYHGVYSGIPYYGESPDHDGDSEGLDPRNLLRSVCKYWLTIMLFCLIVGIVATFYFQTTDKVYKARSLVELSLRRPRIMNQQAAVIEDQGAGASDEIFNTRLQKFKGRAMQEDAIAHYRKQHPECRFQNEDLKELLAHHLKLSLMRRTRLLIIEFSHTDPVFAADFCTAYAEAAESSVFDENRITSDAAVAWLEAQSDTQRGEVEKAEAALLKYRQENKIDVLESQRKTVDDALMDVNKVLVRLESQVAMERELLSAISSVELKPEHAGKLPASIPRADEVKVALDKWMEALAERDSLLSKYTAKHPEVQARDKIVAISRNQALDALNRAKATSASNLELLQKQADRVREMKAEQSRLAAELELQIVERRTYLAALERTRDACDAAYRGILGRIQEARMAADENTATVKIVERASVPHSPVKPRPVKVIVLAVLFGLIGGVGLALLQATLADRIESPNEFERTGWAKVLALIPRARNVERNSVAMASSTREHMAIAEAFAGLRTMLDSPQYKPHNGVILLSSSVPEEGKTVSACNLAITYARHGEKTLLIDFDIRRPQIASVFPLPTGHKNLADFLADGAPEAGFSTLAYPASTPGLSIIAGRRAEHSHPELLNENRLASLLQWARANYDRVILDAPPLGIVSDALSLSALADTVLVVARQRLSRKRAVKNTLHRFREAGVGVLAVILNDVDFTSTHYGYGYGYHYYGGTPEAPDRKSRKRSRGKEAGV